MQTPNLKLTYRLIAEPVLKMKLQAPGGTYSQESVQEGLQMVSQQFAMRQFQPIEDGERLVYPTLWACRLDFAAEARAYGFYTFPMMDGWAPLGSSPMADFVGFKLAYTLQEGTIETVEEIKIMM